jgi:UDP-glucose 4-epimerase
LGDKALITGGAGFIGSHLARRLKAEGRDVVIVDNFATSSRDNVQAILDGQCQLIEASIGQALEDPHLLDDVSEIYHLAAAVGVQLVVDDPAGMIHNNINETASLLQAAIRAKAAVLIASSSEVYGKCPRLPLREDMDLVYGATTASRWGYGLTKAIDEHLAIDLHRQHGLAVTIVRLFNTIGPRQVGRYGMVVPRFVQRGVASQPIEIYGDGKQTRCFCDVRDIVEAMTCLLGTPSCYGQVFNLGSDKQLTIEQLADTVLHLSGSKAGKCYVPYQEVYGSDFEDPQHRLPDVAKIARAIGFKPRRSLELTLGELIELQRNESSMHGHGAQDDAPHSSGDLAEQLR